MTGEDKGAAGGADPAALESWEALAERYAARAGDKPHNAHYDRPAVLGLLGDVAGKRVLDVGCGPGFYAGALLDAGAAELVCTDASAKMAALCAARLAGRPGVRVERRAIEDGTGVPDGWADAVCAPLCLDYVADWDAAFAGFFRALRAGGVCVVSASHPAFDAEYFATERYFEVERVSAEWGGFGDPAPVHGFRRSLQDFVNPALRAGFVLEELHEPRPTEGFRTRDPKRFARLERRPGFLAMRLRRG
ncbi:class I SAM-dependent methyltransferase [Rhodovulum sp. DZ06]|uniref:class I SAM-dependent methyltransferase n=1 Tax=Rhodovulum sp. DZ06 TaxID=3425126 RepID=UPI003D3271F5